MHSTHRVSRGVLLAAFTSLLLCVPDTTVAEEAGPDLNGTWIVNHELSDDTDRQVEVAIRKGGGRIPRTGKRGRGRYRGGPEDQEFYDHISYDETLRIEQQAPEIRLHYDGKYQRVFYTDGRGRVASASGPDAGRIDYSFAYLDGEKLVVESRPRDGGRALETLMLDDAGRLRMELELMPLTFREPIHIVRIYERRSAAD